MPSVDPHLGAARSGAAAGSQLQEANVCNQPAWGLKSRFPNLRFHPIAELQLSERRAPPKLPIFI